MVDTAVPESPKVPFGGVLGNVTHTIGFDAGKVVKNRGLLRKTVDYGACMVRMLEVSENHTPLQMLKQTSSDTVFFLHLLILCSI